MGQVDEGAQKAVSQLVKEEDAHSHHHAEGDDDEGVVQGLLPGRPLDLLQLGLGLFEPLLDPGEKAGLGFLFRLVVLLRGSLGFGALRLFDLLVFSH